MKKQKNNPWREAARRRWVAHIRQVALDLITRYDSVTVDDLRDRIKLPKWADNRLFGAALNAPKLFTRIAHVPTDRKTSHGRPVGIFVAA